uniref:Uncharacterized protein n=1 Tax=viral metagenome TaxID=1070528 RepID=A0A6C0ABU3_9ZZZZ
MELLHIKYFKQFNSSCDSGQCENKLTNKENENENKEVNKESFADQKPSNLESKLDTLLERISNLENDIKTIANEKDLDSMDQSIEEENYHNLPYNPSAESHYGYSFLPPSQWYPTPPQPPICVREKKNNVCPSISDSGFTGVMEWQESNNISKPMGINTAYIDENLNLKK